MILIISEEDDSTTDRVISWLRHYQVDFIRINNTDAFEFYLLGIDERGEINGLLSNGTFTIELKKVKGYWYRRGRLSFRIRFIGDQSLEKLEDRTNRFLTKEYQALADLIYSYLHSLELSIGNVHDNDTNKLQNLKLATECGLLIPKTWLVTTRKQLEHLFKHHRKLLTKSITQGGLYYEDEEIQFEGFSNLIDEDWVKEREEVFAPTLFQEYIEKAYELRVFYLDEVCYTSAIFSQLDDMTKVDFRNYNFNRPNRTPPYILPDSIEQGIIKLMKHLSMRSGSLDILVSTSKKYYFLEVNPIGQFYQVSYPCNYYLEKKVAQYFNHGSIQPSKHSRPVQS